MDSQWGDIKPIQTRYARHHFRSRLEARWAVFFDSFGLHWEYEPEGFDLNGEWYLPDFWLPQLDVFAEVKADTADLRYYRGISKLGALADATGKRVVILLGPVSHVRTYRTPHVVVHGPRRASYFHQWAACLECGQPDIPQDPTDLGDGRLRCGHSAIGSTPELLAAYEAATSARF